MSTKDKERLVMIAKVLGLLALAAGLAWFGVWADDWRMKRLARMMNEEQQKVPK